MEGEVDNDTAKGFLDSMADGVAYPDMAKPIELEQQEKATPPASTPAPTDPDATKNGLPPLPMPPPPTPPGRTPKPKPKPKAKATPKQKDLATIAFDNLED
eukprot:8491968-Alexandrium_andersonii.AAC.1